MTSGESEPIHGDRIIKRLDPVMGAIVGGSDELSELLISPFVDASTLDLSSLSSAAKEAILECRREADEAWERVHVELEKQRVALALSPEEWEEMRARNIVNSLHKFFTQE